MFSAFLIFQYRFYESAANDVLNKRLTSALFIKMTIVLLQSKRMKFKLVFCHLISSACNSSSCDNCDFSTGYLSDNMLTHSV